MPDRERNYQAEVHFALGTIIQGVTVAALGDEVAAALRNLPFPGAPWTFITGFQSLLLCILFWFTFVDHYFFGFRVIHLTAKTHFMFAVLYLILGLLQLIAIRSPGYTTSMDDSLCSPHRHNLNRLLAVVAGHALPRRKCAISDGE